MEAEGGPPRTPAKRILPDGGANNNALRANASGEASTTAAAPAHAGDAATAAVSAAVGVPVKPRDAGKAERLALGVQSCPEKPSHSWLPVEEEEEEDCCCICLDTFDEDCNPAKVTKCGHQYHLQCLMAWRQRSDCCPMCFRTLQLEDAESQALLDSIGESIDRSIDRALLPASLRPASLSVSLSLSRAPKLTTFLSFPLSSLASRFRLGAPAAPEERAAADHHGAPHWK